MSTLDRSLVTCSTQAETVQLGASLVSTLYRKPLTINLTGEMGVGKTTFVQGFARGLSIDSAIPSPTFALEHRYDDVLCHIDLCRLSNNDAQTFLHHSDDFPGIRIIEWAAKSKTHAADIKIHIEDIDGVRGISCTFHDIAIPSKEAVEALWDEVCLPQHIRAHMQCVADVAKRTVEELQKQKVMVRPLAVERAALLHDVLRFVDFKTFDGDAFFTPDEKTKMAWTVLKKKFGCPHEPAATRLVSERGYPDIGTVILTHRGKGQAEGSPSLTIEQKILTYADKRVDLDRIVTLEERFTGLMTRHKKNNDDPEERAWQERMRNLERELFPKGAPF